MRVLRIRGTNLASLPAFELDLAAPPLSQTRIFAITGPTGAGKSTLLDALCLALYDRVPRLQSARAAATEDGLAASDPRTLMRRGTGEASAEVDFVGRDDQIYRARWEVWRARRAPDGRVQDQRVSLFRLDGEELVDLSAGKKTATLPLIADKVGLGFEELRRAVLLAQGDFAAFLAARPDERAALLERMTGTELYAAVSKAAFERAKAARDALEKLEARQSGVETLDPAARAALEAKRDAAEVQIAELLPATERARARAQYFRDADRLAAEAAQALSALEGAREAAAQIPALEAQLELAGRVEALRPRQNAKRDAEAAFDALEARIAATEGRKAELEAARADAQAALEAAEAELQAHRDLAEQSAPLIESARRRDAELEKLEGELEAAAASLPGVEERARVARGALEQTLTRIEVLEAEEREDRAWLEARPALERARGDEETIKGLFDALRRSRAEAESASAHEASLREELEVARGALEAAEAEEAAESVRLASAERALRASREALDEARARGHAELVSGAKAVLEPVAAKTRELRGLVDARAQRGADRRRIARRLRAARAKLDAAERTRGEANLELEGAERALARAAEALDRAETRAGLAARRDRLLEPGSPCPLCGALEHPFAHAAPETLDADVEVLRATVEQSEKTKKSAAQAAEAARERLTEARALLAAEQSTLDGLERGTGIEEAALDALVRRLEAIWLESPLLHRLGLGKLALLLPRSFPDRLEPLRPALEALEDVEAQLERLEREAPDAERAVEAAERRAEEARRVEASRRDAARARRESCEAARRRLEAHEATAAARTRDQAGYVEALARRLSEWPELERLHHAPEALERQVQEAFEEAKTRAEARLRRASSLEALVERRPSLETERERTRAEFEGLSARLDELRAALEAGRVARGRLLGGQPVRAVEAALEEAGRRARDGRQAAERTVYARERSAGELEATRVQLAERFETLRATRERARAEAEAALEAVEDRDAILAALEAPPADTAKLREALDRLRLARAEAESTWRDRDRRQRAHAAEAPPGDLEGAEAAKRETDAALERARTDRAGALAGLEADDAAQQRLRALGPERKEKEEALQLWEDMSALIGSADGKKLRTFAQGLSLDVLVEQANLHLDELRPRYHLRRVSGADMDLEIIDRDMGGETRSTASLSGGETFLVSLALALGLSDASARSVRVESLFIDEGFGALDPESLDVALAALDRLQSMGRTVAIVSHLPEVAERIGYEVRVEPEGPGRSRVAVRDWVRGA